VFTFKLTKLHLTGLPAKTIQPISRCELTNFKQRHYWIIVCFFRLSIRKCFPTWSPASWTLTLRYENSLWRYVSHACTCSVAACWRFGVRISFWGCVLSKHFGGNNVLKKKSVFLRRTRLHQ